MHDQAFAGVWYITISGIRSRLSAGPFYDRSDADNYVNHVLARPRCQIELTWREVRAPDAGSDRPHVYDVVS